MALLTIQVHNSPAGEIMLQCIWDFLSIWFGSYALFSVADVANLLMVCVLVFCLFFREVDSVVDVVSLLSRTL